VFFAQFASALQQQLGVLTLRACASVCALTSSVDGHLAVMYLK
jgi:hypothetical protein